VQQVNFDEYKVVVSFVNVGDLHWKFLVCLFNNLYLCTFTLFLLKCVCKIMKMFLWLQYINAAESNVYFIDPMPNPAEQSDSVT